MTYFDELKKSMNYLSKDKRTIFLGQAVEYPGTAMTNTLKEISKEKKLEMPVCEELQMGISIGLALDGMVPITIYPRWNFLLLAVNQLVNHLDKIQSISNNGFKPKVIIRTGIGSQRPLHPQSQHIGDFTNAFKGMLENIEVIKMKNTKDILPSYKKALNRRDNKSTILVEVSDFYNEK